MTRAIVVAVAVVAALLPHPFGASPIGATALYGGAMFDRRIGWLVALAPFGVVTLVHGAYQAVVLVSVMAGFVAASWAGRYWLGRDRRLPRFAAAVGTGAVLFFLLSNFGVWLAGYYPPTVGGLIECYLRGLPYLGRSLIGDALWCAALFALHETLCARRSRVTAT